MEVPGSLCKKVKLSNNAQNWVSGGRGSWEPPAAAGSGAAASLPPPASSLERRRWVPEAAVPSSWGGGWCREEGCGGGLGLGRECGPTYHQWEECPLPQLLDLDEASG